MPHVAALSSLRLRAAYGLSGVQPSSTAALALDQLFTALVGGSTTTAAALSALGNRDLKPERQIEREGGFDAVLFGDRLQLEATYYNRLSKDALVERPLPTSVGIASRQENIGSVRNWGYEGQASVRLMQTGPVSADVMLTGALMHNRLESLAISGLTFVGTTNPSSRSRVGYPLFGRWDRPILAWADKNGNGVIEENEVQMGDTLTYAGPSVPTRQYAITPVLSFFRERVRLSSQFDHRGGHYQMNFTEINRCNFANDCRAIADKSTPFWEQARSVVINTSSLYRSWWGYFERGDFTRWREASLSITLPDQIARRMRAQRGVLTLTGRNLHVWTRYSAVDPEVNSSPGQDGFEGWSDNPTAPPTRYWIMRLSLNF
jgi:hypothetical protein